MPKVYITSDTHAYHKQILIYEKRPFKDIDEMNKVLIENWNATVKPEDTVYHLGDVAFANKTKASEFVKSLNGNKILIMGNHDECRTRKWWLECGFNEVHREPIILPWHGEQLLLTHDPIAGLYVDKDIIIVHGHVHSKVVAGYDSPRFCCACVERTDYKPILLTEILQ